MFRCGVEDGEHWHRARQLWLQIGEPNDPINDSIATSFIVKKCASIIVLEESEEKVYSTDFENTCINIV